MNRGSCGDESGNRLAGERVEVHRRPFAALEVKESRAGDHRGVIGRKSSRGRKDLDPVAIESFPHGGQGRYSSHVREHRSFHSWGSALQRYRIQSLQVHEQLYGPGYKGDNGVALGLMCVDSELQCV